MSADTKIEWTDATWNPVTGCTKVSPGCDHCYAEGIAHRFAGTPAYPNGFGVTLRPERLDQPMRWRKPRRIFVNSMSDLFHDEIPDDYIARVFGVMGTCADHTFQVLTKRHGRMRSLLNSDDFRELVAEHHAAYFKMPPSRAQNWPGTWPLPNVWLGVSVENQRWADIRIPVLSATPAAVRFLSCEPLLGPVDLSGLLHGTEACTTCGGSGSVAVPGGGAACPSCDYENRISMGRKNVDWVIVGGESGRGARPMHPDWARSLRDQCLAAGVAFHFKQHGEYLKVDRIADAQPGDVWVLGEGGMEPVPWTPATEGAEAHRWGPHRDQLMRRVGKKNAGRELDGRTWNEFPS